ncbi:hypothetical protein [Aquimarina brevivitae]|uniref:DUF4468 domain-containing protein n=1 Tax=Aquimarina brevivitae TaxID=323412 RepID=A0A4Q7PGG6_9FLAO|nr:hypothetical protein [Aquimarina brevivitae]RZS98840.1 hypothetical protein EV197_0040 [Aquimarina brevivitae]
MRNYLFLSTLLFIYLFITPIIVYAQSELRAASDLAGGYNFSVRDTYNAQRIKDEFLNSMIKETTIALEDIKGSPFYTEQFLPGTLVDNLTGKVAEVFLRYNVYSDIFEVKYDLNSSESFGFIQKPGLDCIMDGTKFIYTSFKNHKNVSQSGYLQQINKFDSDITLLKRNYQKLHMPKPAKTSLEKDVPAKLSNHQEYYIAIANEISLLNSKKSKIHKDFPKHQAELKKYVQKQKLKFKTEKDYTILVSYYDSLISNKK